MKKLLILLFSILISFNSYGDWIELTKSETGDIFYVDKDRIKGNNGYVYWYHMRDHKIDKFTRPVRYIWVKQISFLDDLI